MVKKKKDEVIKLDDSKKTQDEFKNESSKSDSKVADPYNINEETGTTYRKEESKVPDNIREFDYGDLQFQCYRCGHRETIDKGVEQGIQVTLPTTDFHRWTITCNRCRNKMEFYFTENFEKAKEVEEEKKKEKALEKAKKKKSKSKKKNEHTKKDSKKEKSVQRICSDIKW